MCASSALVLGAGSALAALTSPVGAQEAAPATTSIHLEAESAVLQGPSVMKNRMGFLGRGYVSDFSRDRDKMTWTFNAPKAGLYDARFFGGLRAALSFVSAGHCF